MEKIGLALEGGAMRVVYTAGAIRRLAKRANPMFPGLLASMELR